LNEDGPDTWTLSLVYLQLGFADGTKEVPIALGRQRLVHRRQVRTPGDRRCNRFSVRVDRG